MIVDLTSHDTGDAHELGTGSSSPSVAAPAQSLRGTHSKVLGPAAAAALQAKRKLPDSFQKPPVPKRKPAAVERRSAPRVSSHAQSSSVTRIAPFAKSPGTHELQREGQNQAAVINPSESAPQPAVPDAAGKHSKNASTDLPELPLLQPMASQPSKAPRRLPGSLAAPAPASSDTRSSGTRSTAANVVSKTGPSEHDTKVGASA